MYVIHIWPRISSIASSLFLFSDFYYCSIYYHPLAHFPTVPFHPSSSFYPPLISASTQRKHGTISSIPTSHPLSLQPSLLYISTLIPPTTSLPSFLIAESTTIQHCQSSSNSPAPFPIPVPTLSSSSTFKSTRISISCPYMKWRLPHEGIEEWKAVCAWVGKMGRGRKKENDGIGTVERW